MEIEVVQKDAGLSGGKETWVRVLSSTVVDWPQVKAALTPEQKAELASYTPTGYHPGWLSAEEKAETGFSYEDFWIFGTQAKV